MHERHRCKKEIKPSFSPLGPPNRLYRTTASAPRSSLSQIVRDPCCPKDVSAATSSVLVVCSFCLIRYMTQIFSLSGATSFWGIQSAGTEPQRHLINLASTHSFRRETFVTLFGKETAANKGRLAFVCAFTEDPWAPAALTCPTPAILERMQRQGRSAGQRRNIREDPLRRAHRSCLHATTIFNGLRRQALQGTCRDRTANKTCVAHCEQKVAELTRRNLLTLSAGQRNQHCHQAVGIPRKGPREI